MSDTLAPPAPVTPTPAAEIRALVASYNASARPGRRIHTAHLRAIYARGAAAAPPKYAHDYGMARAHSFLGLLASCSTPVNPLTPDRDLLPPHHPLSLRAPLPSPPETRPLTAAIIIDSLGRPWRSFLHPRDKNGQFIPTFGNLQLFGRGASGVSDDHYATGRYVGANPDGSVQVRLNAVNDPKQQGQLGKIITVPADQVATVSSGDRRQKASIGGTPTNADQDSVQYRNAATQDAFQEGVARLGDRDTPSVNVGGKPFAEGDRITTQVHSEDGGQDEISSRDGTIKKIATTKDGTPNALIEFDGEPDAENPDGSPEMAILDLSSPDISRADDQTSGLIKGTQARLDRARNQPPAPGPQTGELPFQPPRPATPTPIDELFPPDPNAPDKAPDAGPGPEAPQPEAPPEIVARIPDNAPETDVKTPAQTNPQEAPTPDVQDINRETRIVGVDRRAAPRLAGREQVGERLTAPNKAGEQYGVGAVVKVVPGRTGSDSSNVGRVGIVSNINPKRGVRLHFQDPETGEWKQTKGFFAINSVIGVAEGDVDYLNFMDADRGLLAGFKRISFSTSNTGARIAKGADGLPMQKGDHVAGVRGSDGNVVQGIIQNINPKGDVVEVIPYGGGDKIAISPNNLRWVRNASSSYNASDREDIFVDKNMDHGAASPDRESLKDVLTAAGFSDDTINAVDDTDPADLGDLLRADPAFDNLARREAAIAALAPDDPARHSSQNRADKMYGSVVRAGVAGRISGETIPRKPPADQVTRESEKDEFDAYFPPYFHQPGDTADPSPEPPPEPDEVDLEPPIPSSTPAPPPAPEPGAAPEDTGDEGLPTPPAAEAPAPPAPAPAPEAPTAPAMSPAERASKAYSALATNLSRHPDKRVQNMAKDIQAVANELDRAVENDKNNNRAAALENLERVAGLAKLIRVKNKAVLQDMVKSSPAERNLVTNGIFRMIADAERISGGRDRALSRDNNPRTFDPASPIAKLEGAPEAPDAPITRAPETVRTPATGGLVDQALAFPDGGTATPAEMDQAFTDLIAAVNADGSISPIQKTKMGGALTRARSAVGKAYDPDRSDDQREALLHAAADRLDSVAKDMGGDKGDALAVVGGKLESMAGDLPAGLPTPPPPTTPTRPTGGRSIPAPRRPTPDAAPPTPAPAPTTPGPESASTPEVPEAATPAAPGDWDFTTPDTPVESGASTPPTVPTPSTDPTKDVWDALQKEFDVSGFDTPEDAQEQARRNASPAVEALFQVNGSDLGRTREALVQMFKDNGSEQAYFDATKLIHTWAGQRGIGEMQAAGLPLHDMQTMREAIGRAYAGLTDPSGDVSLLRASMDLLSQPGGSSPELQNYLSQSATGMAQLLEHKLPQGKSRDDTIAYYNEIARVAASGGDITSVPKPKVEAPDNPNFKRKDLGNGAGLGYVGADNASFMTKVGGSYQLGVLASPEETLAGKTTSGRSLIGYNGQSYVPVGYYRGPATAEPAYTNYIAASGTLTSPLKERALSDQAESGLRDARDFAPGSANWNTVDPAAYNQARQEQAYRLLSEQLSTPGGAKLSAETIRTIMHGQNLHPEEMLLSTARVYRNGNINVELSQGTLDLWGDKTDANMAAIMTQIDKLMAKNGINDKPVSVRISDDTFELDEKVSRKSNSSTLAWAILADHSISVKASYPNGSHRGGLSMMDQTNRPGGTQWSDAVGGKTTGLTTLTHEWGHMTDITDRSLHARTIGQQNAIDKGDSPNQHEASSVNRTTVLLDTGEVEWYDYPAIEKFAKATDPTLSTYAKSDEHELRAEQFAEWFESDGQTTSSTARFFYGTDADRKATARSWFDSRRAPVSAVARNRYRTLVDQGMNPEDAAWQAFRENYGAYNRSIVNHGPVYSSLVGITGDQQFTGRLWGTRDQINAYNQARLQELQNLVPDASAPAPAPAGGVAP